MITIRKINDEQDLMRAFQIRRIVFMDEQQVPEEEEFDQFEKESVHFLAFLEDEPCGAARWRKTGEGCKLERFAVLKEFRGKGVGMALVRSVIDDIRMDDNDLPMYLNAQVDAVPLYEKFGFTSVGDIFMECDIKHQRMELK